MKKKRNSHRMGVSLRDRHPVVTRHSYQ
jgi:hypothetical protein